MGHQGAEAAAEIVQSGDIFFQIGDDDGDMIEHRLLDGGDVPGVEGTAAVEAGDQGADRAFERLDADRHGACLREMSRV